LGPPPNPETPRLEVRAIQEITVRFAEGLVTNLLEGFERGCEVTRLRRMRSRCEVGSSSS